MQFKGERLKHFLFASSALVASGSAYLLNLSLIYILDSKVEYSHFLSLNSWAVYLSTFSYLLILDLYLGPNRDQYQLEALLGLSGLCIVSFVGLLLLMTMVSGSTKLFAITIGTFGFSLFKLACQYFIYSKKIAPVAWLRYLRSGLILLAIGLLFACREKITLSGATQVLLQGTLCLVALSLVWPLYGLFKQTGLKEVRQVLRFDGWRLFKRNASLLVDTIHMPLFYLFVSGYSAELPALFIYALGILLPGGYVVSTLLREQVLVRDGLIEKMLRSRLGIPMLTCYGLIICMASIFALLKSDYALIGLILLLTGLISLSGAIGTVLYRRGLENFDLGINLIISSLLVVLYFYSQQSETLWVVNLSLLCLLFKFCAQLLVAFMSTRISD
ncbi:hypothetical protein [Endozoicomonas sp. YOMI1]|uniref:hypothetical protein n=1 Tax=Endozoicomonas sp. YOMI1 TaxID=2828739 RepID=UPI0021480924|nr:hypothetical protein [Endozoicomonas sp. YOMI1]